MKLIEIISYLAKEIEYGKVFLKDEQYNSFELKCPLKTVNRIR